MRGLDTPRCLTSSAWKLSMKKEMPDAAEAHSNCRSRRHGQGDCLALGWITSRAPQFEFLGYVVSDLSRLGQTDSRDQVLGDFTWLRENRGSIDALALGIGAPSIRLKLAAELRHLLPGIEWPTIIHPTAIIELDSARIAEGCFIGAGVTATVNITLEAFALCNFGCTLGHEARIGAGAVVNPGANISGGVVIGTSALVGTGAQILNIFTSAQAPRSVPGRSLPVMFPRASRFWAYPRVPGDQIELHPKPSNFATRSSPTTY